MAERFGLALYSPHAAEQIAARNISRLDVEETMRNPDRTYASRRGSGPERTVAEKAFTSQGVVRVVYVVEPAEEALAKYDIAMEKLYPGWRERSEAFYAQLREKLPVQEGRERAYTVATVVTVIRMKRRQRTGDGGL